MITLDRSKPYGTVHGGAGPHAYEQDGKLFDHEGKHIVPANSKPEPAAVPAASKAEPSAEATGTIKVDGADVAIDTMEAPELHALAVKLGVKIHPNAGAVKVRSALLAADKAAQPEDSQLNTQLQG